MFLWMMAFILLILVSFENDNARVLIFENLLVIFSIEVYRGSWLEKVARGSCKKDRGVERR